ncbi:MAG: NAD(P)-dependent oxidoreductase [Proteobacteria bacterium]|nr:NAD(P)-dependent oxidoreductase [Pseudomonadota bacterium]
MGRNSKTPEIESNRLSPEAYADNFSDLHPMLSAHQASIEAARCYYCYDAPCIKACPTGIDIPSFIQKISTGNRRGSAHKILEENIFGAMCARVCPTEVLCEQACVRTLGENKPVAIGALQRFATDPVLDDGSRLFERGPESGKHVAIVGAGPAGLSCAHRLAMLGHRATVFEAEDKQGGLNEYGIAAYKVVDDIAQREIDYILDIGGIDIRFRQAIASAEALSELGKKYDAVFIGLGLGGAKALGLEGEDLDGVMNAVDYIKDLRQAKDLAALPVGRRIVVIGGGMTAVDIASQTRRLGAEEVTIVYRRGPQEMGASAVERDLAQTGGVRIRYWAKPVRLIASKAHVVAVEFERTRGGRNGSIEGTGEKYEIDADMVFRAIGQQFSAASLDGSSDLIALRGGRIKVDGERRTSVAGIWAGGDCVDGGQDLTVVAVEDGKIAAHSIDRYLHREDESADNGDQVMDGQR